ncbi:UMF1 family MFS transporter [Breoghania corrubedonensis]|uniref:UMF1 family MFS transporter n=2 Tax=Breoghania corrubedonensis TaxID=665038 RepID=A0A2T5VAW0_9HYPH|nr:MFS transporter [Breoghania corrubedonensis]PTW60888.1 UMF1 family MFS transporter [Breoghania corrubedonensis]
MFDWAAQPYFTLITTFVFAPYFAAHLAASPAEGQSLWGYATGAAGLVIALASPFFGAVADAAGRRKPWIAAFSVMLICGAGALWFAAPGAPGAIAIALAAYALASLGAEFATVFTNAMMPDLVGPKRLGRLSGIGWATGYLGGLLSLVVVLGFLAADAHTGRTLLGHLPAFGLDPATFAGDRASGPLTALWYVVFVAPLFLFVPDTARKMPVAHAMGLGFTRLKASLAHARSDKTLWLFLAASMGYRDALTALFAFGGIYAAGQLGWRTMQIGLFGILLTITGTAGALAGGFLDDRLGPKPVLVGAMAILIGCCMGIVSIDRDTILFVIDVAPPEPGHLFASAPEILYLVLGGLIGAAAGPLQAASRTLLVHLALPDRITETFGLYAFAGKATSFIGPVSVALVTSISGSQRIGISAIIVLFVVGAVLLAKVPARRAAQGAAL